MCVYACEDLSRGGGGGGSFDCIDVCVWFNVGFFFHVSVE